MIEHAFGGLYRGKRVFVTGHTGFKGSWLVLWLARLGAEVHGYALEPPTLPSLFEDAGVGEALASHQTGDVRDPDALLRAVEAARPEFVFHLAAQSLVRLSYSQPRDTYDVNVMGTVNVLDAVRRVASVRVCQVVTSDKCYENREWVYAYRENDPLGGYDPYSSSKGCAELAVSAYRRSFFAAEGAGPAGTSLASVRAGNVIGGGDWAQDRILPDCVRALQRGEPVLVRNPHAVRPWQHVLEPLSGYLSAAACQWEDPIRFAEAWNFGPSAAANLPVREIVERVLREWGGEASWRSPSTMAADGRREESMPPHEARFLKLDITKAQNLLHWGPVFSVEEAVAATVRWYRETAAHGEVRAVRSLCLDQIHDYTTRAAGMGAAWAAPARSQI